MFETRDGLILFSSIDNFLFNQYAYKRFLDAPNKELTHVSKDTSLPKKVSINCLIW